MDLGLDRQRVGHLSPSLADIYWRAEGKMTHGKLVELAKGLQASVVLRIRSIGRRHHRSTRARRELVRYRASQYVLA